MLIICWLQRHDWSSTRYVFCGCAM